MADDKSLIDQIVDGVLKQLGTTDDGDARESAANSTRGGTVELVETVVTADVQIGPFLASTGRETQCVRQEDRTPPDEVRYGCFSMGEQEGPNGSGLIATVQFDVEGDGQSPLELDQVRITDPDGTLQNAGQYLALRWRPWAGAPASIFARLGVDTMLGLSFERGAGRALSLAFGGKSEEMIVLSTAGELRTTVTYSWAAGLFWDRDNSLLASLVVSGLDESMATANASPSFWNE